MAKLSARGRTELQRWERAVEGDAVPANLRDLGIIKERRVRALMSDRKVLEKVYTYWRPGPYGDSGATGGTWKVAGRLKPEVTPEAWADIMAKRWTRL